MHPFYNTDSAKTTQHPWNHSQKPRMYGCIQHSAVSKCNFRYKNTVITAVFHTAAPVEPIRLSGLHPFGCNHIAFGITDRKAAEITQTCTALRNNDTLGSTDDAHEIRIKFGNEQRSPVPEHMIVIRTAAGIHQPQLTAAGDPVLLGIVITQIRAIVKAQLLRRIEMQTVGAAGNVACHIVADAQVICAAVRRNGRFAQTAGHLHRKGITGIDKAQLFTIKGASDTATPEQLCHGSAAAFLS